MPLFFYILGFEFAAIFFYITQYYYKTGWFSQYSISIRIVVILLLSLICLSVILGTLFSNKHNKLSEYTQNWMAEPKHQHWLLLVLAFSLVILVSLAASKLSFLSITFGLIPIRLILIFINLVLAQVLVTVLYMRFNSFAILISGIFSFFINSGLIIVFVTFVILKIVLLTPIVYDYSLYSDTLLYSQMAQQIHSGFLSIVDLNHYPPFYPILISPLFSIDQRHIYQNMIILNALVSTSAIFPIYFLARSFLSKRISLLFAIACMCYPSQLYYTSLFMSENIAYPLFFWALYFCFTNPPHKKWIPAWDVLAGLSVGLLWLTRYMTLVIIPVYLLIWWIKPEMDSGVTQLQPAQNKIKRLLLVLSTLIGIYLVWVIPGLLQGVPIINLLGLHIEGTGNETTNAVSNVMPWIWFSFVYFLVMAGPILHQLLGVFSGRYKSSKGIKHDWFSPLNRWILSSFLIISSMIFVVTRHAWLALYNYPDPRNYLGRYIIYLPVLLWLTALIGIKYANNSFKSITVSGLLAVIAGFLSYQYMSQQDWLLNNFLYSGSIDVFTPNYYSWLYLVYFLIFVIISSIFMYYKKPNAAISSTLFFLILINIGSWPGYLSFIEARNDYGRPLDELITKVLDNPEYDYILQHKDKIEIFGLGEGEKYADEIRIRGIDPAGMRISHLNFKKVYVGGCNTIILLRYDQNESFAVFEDKRECLIKPDVVFSKYTYAGVNFKVVRVNKNLLK